MRGGVLIMVRLYLVKIICLGVAHFELRAEGSACTAIVHALDRYPQACAVGARRIAGAA